ncbi:hypothetical protein JB92DRAFT_3147784 [Gautieria morchelliformis]|nr:hypothetical protein JB92DRAFT_3147784 [Gautieria morchelliformis]
MSSVATISDEEVENEDLGKLKPMELTAVERIYNSHDRPNHKSYMDKFYTRFEKKIGAEEWFIQSGSGNKHLLLRFPARIIRSTRDSKLTSYGNKDGEMSKFDLRGLRKIKMVWALQLELEGPSHLRPKAKYIENILHLIQQERDDILNAGLRDEEEPRVHAFTRRQENGTFLVLVNSENLFDDVPFSSAGSPVKITRSVLETPANAPHNDDLPETSSRNDVARNNEPTTPKKSNADFFLLRFLTRGPYNKLSLESLTLADFPDPQARFSTIKNVAGSVPYNSALTEGTLVNVLTTLRMWHIKPDEKNPNGSRAYQLVLKRMQVLPTIQDGVKSMTTIPTSPATPTDPTSSSMETSLAPQTPTPAPWGSKATGKQKRPLTETADKITPPAKRSHRASETS